MANILIVGVGGQGSLLASRILGSIYLNRGLEVKVSEVHGMSQRGGSVVTYVRGGESIASPIIPVGEADVIIAFERLEALRWAHYLKRGGTVVYSTQEISPMPVITGAAEYPTNIENKIANFGVNQIAIDALGLALEAGNAKAANVVLMGAASKIIGGDDAAWQTALSENVPPKFLELNMRAFTLGKRA
ncbi:MAG: indolepyruvate oxidoreductase subunit beta [Clostridia bacterium]